MEMIVVGDVAERSDLAVLTNLDLLRGINHRESVNISASANYQLALMSFAAAQQHYAII
jgi:hypothetical protein